MKFNKEILIIALVMSILDVIMMGLIRKYYLSTQIVKYILPVGMIIYMFQPILFYKALFFEGIGVFNIVWNSVSNLLILFCLKTSKSLSCSVDFSKNQLANPTLIHNIKTPNNRFPCER